MPLTGIQLRLAEVVIGIVALLALSHAAVIGLWRGAPQHDFGYLWLAGKTWLAGSDPYGANYPAMLDRLSMRAAYPGFFPLFYPPSWFPMASAFALLPLRVADQAWVILSIAMLAGAQAVIFALFKGCRKSLLPLGTALAYTFISSGTTFGMWLGQTSAFIVFGYVVLLAGLVRRNDALAAVGAAIVMMKPNLGAILILPLLFRPGGFRVLVYGAVLTVMLAAPVFIRFGLTTAVKHYAVNLSAYGAVPMNRPGSETGIGNIFHLLFNVDVSPSALTLVGALCAALIYVMARRPAECGSQSEMYVFMFAGISCVLMFARVHIHDLIFIGLLLQPALILRNGHAGTLSVAIAALLLLNPESTAIHLGLDYTLKTGGQIYADTIAAIAGAVLFSGAVALAWPKESRSPSSVPSPALRP